MNIYANFIYSSKSSISSASASDPHIGQNLGISSDEELCIIFIRVWMLHMRHSISQTVLSLDNFASPTNTC